MKKSKSFTIVEIMVGMFIFTLVIGGSIVLIQQTLVMVSIAKNRLVASYLAQEGVELIRNIRDNNWLEQNAGNIVEWSANLTDESFVNYNDTTPRYYIDYNGPGLLKTSTYPCGGDTCYTVGPYLYLDPNNDYYSYDVNCFANPRPAGCTNFRRWIWIFRHNGGEALEPGGVDALAGSDVPIRIEVHVSWEERGRMHEFYVTANDYLYNWYGSY